MREEWGREERAAREGMSERHLGYRGLRREGIEE